MEYEEKTILTQTQIDALREVSNIGAGSAITALSQFINKPVEMEPTAEVIFNSTEDFRLIFNGLPLVSVVSSEIPDKISGHLLIIFEEENTLSVAKLLLGNEASTMVMTNELAISAIKEIGNVMFSSYLAAMGSMTSMSIMISPPSFDSGSTHKVFDSLEVSQSIKEEQITVCFESSFWIKGSTNIPGYIIFVPSPISLKSLLTTLGVRGSE